ncbi:hypothetical protein WN48_10275 [Eufriesea mexicana]|uniref:Uncharacterized protein n=1 Tax=Eufriesea mexicana TaxID=516756 RepID=A0A310S6T4_9HYME|nr:hypothetical protein WN48_10275 [Eufriesea mexicana]
MTSDERSNIDRSVDGDTLCGRYLSLSEFLFFFSLSFGISLIVVWRMKVNRRTPSFDPFY